MNILVTGAAGFIGFSLCLKLLDKDNIVIGLERNGQHDDERERHTTTVRGIKNRFSGYFLIKYFIIK